jgi:phosphoglycerate kinase
LIRGLDDLEIKGKRVLVRADLNVPINKGEVTDDSRIRATLPTLTALRQKGASRIIVCSHLGRPKGVRDPSLSLRPVGQRLADLIERRVRVTEDPTGPPSDFDEMDADEIGMLENLRFDPREEENDAGFADELAKLGDVYVNDAFGTAHRAHASVVGVAQRLPSAAGLLLHKELEVLSRVLEDPKRPFVVVLGGAKVSDKIGVVANLLDKADKIIIGGAMANTFLTAQGWKLGESRVEKDKIDDVVDAMVASQSTDVQIMLPTDLVAADSFDSDSAWEVVSVQGFSAGKLALDIGPETTAAFAEAVTNAGMVLWNGPMGVFEWDSFAKGTKAVATAVCGSEAFTVVGGGDTLAALSKFDLTEGIDHLSTGGGASLEFLEGKELPGVAVLEKE